MDDNAKTPEQDEVMIPLSEVAPLVGLIRQKYERMAYRFQQYPELPADLFEVYAYNMAARAMGWPTVEEVVGVRRFTLHAVQLSTQSKKT